jgi:hypothetical protein
VIEKPLKESLGFAAAVAAFLVPIFAFTWFRGEPLHVLHYTDERLHYVLIHEFSNGRFPLDGPTYQSATTPLFHLTLSPLDALGASRFVLRAANLAVVVLFAGVVFYDLFRVGGRRAAWLWASVLVFAPYMAPRGFVLLTENYSYLWFWLAARPWLFPRRTPMLADALASASFLTLAALTRQSWLWACPLFALLAIESARKGAPAPGRARPWLLAAPLALPILITLPFFVIWGGLVPENWHDVNQSSGLNPKAIAFTLVLFGLYSGIAAPSKILGMLTVKRALSALCGALAIGILVGLRHESLFTDSGFVWFVSDRFPNVLGANLLLVGLLAAGLLALYSAFREGDLVTSGYVVVFALSFSFVRMCYQKYYEVPLLAILAYRGVRSAPTRLDQVGQLVWVLAGAAYLVHRIGRVDPPLLGG